ncbi:MAG TPA: M1 family metallopeptidase [Longimicrobiales bacterium]|nr:M1 family metallopeptidase [Longimicrobiales bacterium]
MRPTLNRWLILTLGLALAPGALPEPALSQATTPPYTRADTLRGSQGPARDWWDVTFYDLAVRVEPADSAIMGSVGIVYRVLEPGSELQVDLQRPMEVDSVLWRGRRLDHRRDGDAVFITAPPPDGGEGASARVGSSASAAGSATMDTVTVFYHGRPRVAPMPPWDGGFVWSRDPTGTPWVATANQGLGASVWWPNKDTQADEPDSQRVAITVPEPLTNVSNGRLRGVTEHEDGTATWEWFVASPINNYNIAINAGAYAHFGDTISGEAGALTLDYWPLEVNLEAARAQFAQTPDVVACFEHWFGPYPFYEDGLKLVETPYLGMEHQSAVAYGNAYGNGYLGRDLSGTGLGLEWDFIIVHELAHEWWGNSITTADLADMWVHEGFANYAESLYTECLRGEEAGARYVRGVRSGVANDRPIIPAYGVNAEGSGDMYNKGGNMLHTIRQIVDDDDRWRGILRGLQRDFRHQIVTGRQVRDYMSEAAGVDLEPVFRQYLETTEIPVLEYRVTGDSVRYRWADVVDGFDMPVDVTTPAGTRRIHPTPEWRTERVPGAGEEFEVDPDFYVLPREIGTRTGALSLPTRSTAVTTTSDGSAADRG